MKAILLAAMLAFPLLAIAQADPTPGLGGGGTVPEPGIWGLLAVAGVALALSRFNKRK